MFCYLFALRSLSGLVTMTLLILGRLLCPATEEAQTVTRNRPVIFHAINLSSWCHKEIHPPVVHTAEQCTSQDVAAQGRDDTFPDVKANVQIRSTQPDAERDEEHVGHNVIQSQRHESKDGPPQANDFGAEIFCLHAQEEGKTHEPVASDSS